LLIGLLAFPLALPANAILAPTLFSYIYSTFDFYAWPNAITSLDCGTTGCYLTSQQPVTRLDIPQTPPGISQFTGPFQKYFINFNIRENKQWLGSPAPSLYPPYVAHNFAIYNNPDCTGLVKQLGGNLSYVPNNAKNDWTYNFVLDNPSPGTYYLCITYTDPPSSLYPGYFLSFYYKFDFGYVVITDKELTQVPVPPWVYPILGIGLLGISFVARRKSSLG
jgi:hypothetical protein